MEKYTKIKTVGKGSFGSAVLVQSSSLNNKKLFIIKIIDISKMDRKQREEALNEVHVLKAMRHPYIITYRESFMEKRCLCIVMDFADGGDLYTKIAKQKEKGQLFSEKQILDWFVQMALALKHVHDRKILHRDLKTQNIFMTSKGDIKIGDFGIARVLEHTYDCAKTAIGTPYYLSPEICQEKPYNQKSDIWSLGCILYELTTLNHAFDANSMKGLVLKILKGTYPPIPAQYSNDIRNLISEMLTKDPSKRPSIRKILEKEFLKNRIGELFQNTLLKQELQRDSAQILEITDSPQDFLLDDDKKENQIIKSIDKNEEKSFKKLDQNPKVELPLQKINNQDYRSSQNSNRNDSNITKSPIRNQQQASHQQIYPPQNYAQQQMLPPQFIQSPLPNQSIISQSQLQTPITNNQIQSQQQQQQQVQQFQQKENYIRQNSPYRQYPSNNLIGQQSILMPIPPSNGNEQKFPQIQYQKENSVSTKQLNTNLLSDNNNNKYSQEKLKYNIPEKDILKPISINIPLQSNLNQQKSSSQLPQYQSIQQQIQKPNVGKLVSPLSNEDDESLEEQGYGYLIESIKDCLNKGNINNNANKNDYENDHEDNNQGNQQMNSFPKFLEVEGKQFMVPGINDRDTISFKIEALRFYLEKQLGSNNFYEAYRLLELIVCEESYYENSN